MSVFFLLMTFLSFGAIHKTGGIWVAIQTNGWCLKGFIFFFLMIASYFLPPEFPPVFVWICQFGGGFFLLAQIVVLVDFAHVWNKSWVEKEWLAGLIITSVILGLLWLAQTILMYVFWSNCPVNNVLTSVSGACCLVLLALALRLPRGSLLEVSLVGAYCAYLCMSSYLSQPSEWQCMQFIDTSATKSVWAAVISFIITLCALGYTSFSTASTLAEAQGDAAPASTSVSKEHDDPNYKKMEEGHAGDEPPEPEADPDAEYYPYWRFNLVMFLACLYVAMILTGWSLGDNTTQSISVGSGVVSMWVKQATQWGTMLLYLWVLIAPYVCKCREFPDEVN